LTAFSRISNNGRKKKTWIVNDFELKEKLALKCFDEPQTVTLSIKGPKEVLAGDIKTGGQWEILNPELYIAEVTGKVNLILKMKN